MWLFVTCLKQITGRYHHYKWYKMTDEFQILVAWIWRLFVRASLYKRREEKPTRCCWMMYCTYNLLNIFRALICCSNSFPHPGRIACCPVPDRRPPATKALHTIWGNNTSIFWSSWWWAYKCPKHVEQVISVINNSVASSWFFFSILVAWFAYIYSFSSSSPPPRL